MKRPHDSCRLDREQHHRPVAVAASCKLAAMGDLVTLRPVTEDDLAWLASLRNSPAASGLHEWHGWTDPQRRRRKWAESGLLGDDGGTLIVLHDTDRVGHVSWRRVKTGPTAFGWAIAVGLAPDFRGRGYGSEAQRLLARYLFAHTQVNRIEATTEITNVAEQRALEKAGFTREGILRGTTFRQGRWHDHVIYSVLRDEVNLMDASAEDGAGALARSGVPYTFERRQRTCHRGRPVRARHPSRARLGARSAPPSLAVPCPGRPVSWLADPWSLIRARRRLGHADTRCLAYHPGGPGRPGQSGRTRP